MKWIIYRGKVVDPEAKEIICTVPEEKDPMRRLRKMLLIASAPELKEENVLLKLKLKEMTERYEGELKKRDDWFDGKYSGSAVDAITSAKQLYEEKKDEGASVEQQTQ